MEADKEGPPGSGAPLAPLSDLSPHPCAFVPTVPTSQGSLLWEPGDPAGTCPSGHFLLPCVLLSIPSDPCSTYLSVPV